MNIANEKEMIRFAMNFAKRPDLPSVIVLTGDVGAGKTTFTRALAMTLGVTEMVASPSFTISRRYALRDGGELVHYDFYRLSDPGLMAEDLAESINTPGAITVIEWGQDVLDLVPDDACFLTFAINDDGSHTVTEKTKGATEAAGVAA